MKTLFVLTLFLVSCASDSKKEVDEKPRTLEQRIVGRIASVSQTGKFVLIQKYGPGTLPLNSLYQSRGADGQTAALRPSGEQVRDFFAADLLSGTVEKGDAVMAYPLPAKEEETNEDPSANGENEDSEGPENEGESASKNSQNTENIKKQG
ncbi:MAG: hypothetical protein ACPGJR_12605 [Akkermansiaceae bacterium]